MCSCSLKWNLQVNNEKIINVIILGFLRNLNNYTLYFVADCSRKLLNTHQMSPQGYYTSWMKSEQIIHLGHDKIWKILCTQPRLRVYPTAENDAFCMLVHILEI